MRRLCVFLGVFFISLVHAAQSEKPFCPNRLVLQKFFPDSASIVSLFAGDASIEAHLAKTLATTITAIDSRSLARAIPPGVEWVKRDLISSKSIRDSKEKFDRVLMISPWISEKQGSLFGPSQPAYTPRLLGVGSARRAEQLVRKQIEQLTPSMKVVFDPCKISTQWHQLLNTYNNQELLYRRLGILVDAIAIANQFLQEGGKIYLVSELVDTLALSDESEADQPKNLLLQNDGLVPVVSQMINEEFPAMNLVSDPNLKEAIFAGAPNSQNPWGQDALRAWVLWED